jgi:hypothetical protein
MPSRDPDGRQTQCGILERGRRVRLDPTSPDGRHHPNARRAVELLREAGRLVVVREATQRRASSEHGRGLDGSLGARRRAQLHARIVEMKIDRSIVLPSMCTTSMRFWRSPDRGAHLGRARQDIGADEARASAGSVSSALRLSSTAFPTGRKGNHLAHRIAE